MAKLKLEGAINARDIGGIETPLGKIKSNKLLRSGELSRLTPQDVTTLRTIGLSRVVDLRTQLEQANSPNVVIAGVEYVDVPIIEATTFGITYEKSDGVEIALMLKRGIDKMVARGETASEHLSILYRKFVDDEFSRKGYGKFLKTLAQPTTGATLWHCSVGKDRCGTCAALLLYCLGASRQQIYADYILTNEQTAQHKNMILNKVRGFVSEEDLKLIDIMRSVKEEYLDSFFNGIENKFGTTGNFLAACGVTDADVQALRQNYLVGA